MFPRRPTEPVSLDVDSSRHARVFSEDVMSGINESEDIRASQAKSRFDSVDSYRTERIVVRCITSKEAN